MLKGNNPESQIEQLKDQAHCLGVYAKVPGRDVNGSPMWKHVDADLCIASSEVEGEKGWVIAQARAIPISEHGAFALRVRAGHSLRSCGARDRC